MPLRLNDTEFFNGLQIIQSKLPDTLVQSELGVVNIPEAVPALFSLEEQNILFVNRWTANPVYGGYMYLFR
jgi:hypothetical protein